MAIAMTTGYSAQTEGALLCIEAASDWALTCVDQLAAADSHVPQLCEHEGCARGLVDGE